MTDKPFVEECDTFGKKIIKVCRSTGKFIPNNLWVVPAVAGCCSAQYGIALCAAVTGLFGIAAHGVALGKAAHPDAVLQLAPIRITAYSFAVVLGVVAVHEAVGFDGYLTARESKTALNRVLETGTETQKSIVLRTNIITGWGGDTTRSVSAHKLCPGAGTMAVELNGKPLFYAVDKKADGTKVFRPLDISKDIDRQLLKCNK